MDDSRASANPGRAPAVTLALAVAAGLCVSRLFPGGFVPWLLAALISGGTWLVLILRNSPRIATAALLGGWLALSAAWHDWRWSELAPRDVSRLATDDGVSVRLIAKVDEPAWILSSADDPSAPPWRPPERTLTTLHCRELVTESGSEPVVGMVRLSLHGHYPELTCGDVVSVIGRLRRPAAPLNPGEFDYRNWLKSQGVRAILHAESTDCLEWRTRELSLLDAWGRIRQALRQQARQLFATALREETSSVAETLLLGGRRRLDDELRQAFAESGMLHVLAISGMNVALLGLWLTILARLAGFTSRRGLAMAVAGLVFYAAVTDGDPPVVRATVMAVLGAAALWLGRQVSSIQIIAATLLGMIVVSPADLFDAGAQLSFLAVLAISRSLSVSHQVRAARRAAELPSEPSRILPGWLSNAGKVWRECLVVSFGIWLATTPLVAWHFQIVSPVGFVLNVLLAPLIVVLMWSGYSFLIVGMIAPILSAPFAALFDACLLGLIRSVTWASAIHFGHFSIASPPAWWMLGYYSGAGALLLGGAGVRIRKVALRGILAWTVVGLAAGLMPKSHGELSCRFLAVGHGLSVLMELPNGKTVLYDAGSLGNGRRAARTVEQEFRRRGLHRIDAVILSHADADHCNALPELLDHVPIGSVLIGPGFLEDDLALPGEIVEACAGRNVPVGLLAAGHQIALDPDVVLRVLHPLEEFYSEADNPLSLVAAVEFQGRRILLTGDLEHEGLDELLRQPPLVCDVLLSPHHGSRAANPARLAEWSQPKYVVVSTGDAASADRVAETYPPEAQVLATARHGAIEFCINARGELRVETFRGGNVASRVD